VWFEGATEVMVILAHMSGNLQVTASQKVCESNSNTKRMMMGAGKGGERVWVHTNV
jgi:hypothetical protein